MKLLPLSTLQIALGASIAVHAALLTVRLVDPQAFNRVLQDNTLEVILVNANTQEQPDKAQAIAQAALAGGGEEKSGRASSPLPPALLNTEGQDNEQEHERQMQELEAQKHLLLQVKNMLTSLPPERPRQEALTPEQAQREQKQKQLVKAAGRNRTPHQAGKRQTQKTLHQPGHARGGLCAVLRQVAPHH